MAKVIKLKNTDNSFEDCINDLLNICKNDLISINATILEKIESDIPLIKKISSHIVNSGGKRLRPLLTSCAYQMCKKPNDENNRHIGLGAAVEFIHAATLLHDDVIDASKKRRGKLSANEIWGNKMSVLIGDFLFSRSFQLMSKDGSKEILQLLSNTSVQISEGEVLELNNDKDLTINENIYFDVIKNKTASLFSASCQVGGMVTEATNEKIEALKTYGLNFGMCFQLIDDAIDYSSSSYNLGKNIGDDFKEGKITLPIILAYLRSNSEEKNFWKKTIQDLNQDENDFEKALDIIKKYDCIYDTIKRSKHFANIAIDSLGAFKNNIFKDLLIKLINSSISRLR
ncbi:MAG: Octaprenyl-diphosphate synthase [Alphaproteobacteria bacterium MarineAlpha5_Bin9]|nr:MAG: Octaprenyl-diphosphate synthase [Alphaproteobacteria bacterium MarineAlpha5_Bin9]|tara:strand:- start:5386 stop:6414 length:1029 start_codon:yes stop_codon:yes gene_type:complete